MLHRLLALLAIAATPLLTRAADAPAASQPATTTSQPATLPAPDYSTPRNAFLTWLRAQATRDVNVIAQSIAWDNQDDRKAFTAWARATAEDIETPRAISQFLLEHFPHDEHVQKTAAMAQRILAASQQQNARFLADAPAIAEAATITEKADTATITPRLKSADITLKKVAGQWRFLPEIVNVRPDRPDPTRARVVRLVSRTRELQQIEIEKFKADVKAKKYATGQEALTALNKIGAEAERKAHIEIDAPP